MKKTAVALAWTPELAAPVIIASGKAELAEKMLEIADSYGIKKVADPVLADVLSGAGIGTLIPPETWHAVSAIFAFLDEGIQKRWFS